MGHRVFVLQPPPLICAESNFKDVPTEKVEGISLIDVAIPDWFWSRRMPLEKLIKKGVYSLVSLFWARDVIRREKIDLMILYNIPQYPYMFIKGPAKVFDYADDYVSMLQQELGRFSNQFTTWLAKSFLHHMVSRSEHVFAVSNVLSGSLDRKAVVLPNGVSVEKAETARAHPLPMNIPSPVIGFIGSFEYFIDFDIILDVAAALPESSFLLVGTGRDWKKVQEAVVRRGIANVHMPGGVPHQDVFRYIDKMDICLNIFKKIPVSDRACPIKLFEYLIMGKPVITTRLAELAYIDNGFLFYGDDVQEICNAIRRILDKGPEVAGMILKGKERVFSDYTWDQIAIRFLAHVSRETVS
jgi:glycosyltransferase involved in cell wall biosynthesis